VRVRLYLPFIAQLHVALITLSRMKGDQVNDFKKVSAAAAPVQASSLPIGAIAPAVTTRAAHPLDAIRQKAQELEAKRHAKAIEFDQAQRKHVRIVRPESFWCGFHNCRGEIEQGQCTICRRRVSNVVTDPHTKIRQRLPEHVINAADQAEVVRLQKEIMAIEREIEQHRKDSEPIVREFNGRNFNDQEILPARGYLRNL
jgi:hypothetical protein